MDESAGVSSADLTLGSDVGKIHVDTQDDTSTMTTIRCWGVKEYDQIHLNRPYAAKLDHNKDWGFSTRSIRHTFKLLG